MIENWRIVILAHEYSQLKERHLADGGASESVAHGSSKTANIGGNDEDLVGHYGHTDPTSSPVRK